MEGCCATKGWCWCAEEPCCSAVGRCSSSMERGDGRRAGAARRSSGVPVGGGVLRVGWGAGLMDGPVLGGEGPVRAGGEPVLLMNGGVLTGHGPVLITREAVLMIGKGGSRSEDRCCQWSGGWS